MELVEALVSGIKARDGAAAAADHRGLIGLWRRCNRRFERNQHADWLQGLIIESIPVSLNLANDLFYYWTGQHGIVDDQSAAAIGRAMAEKVRAAIQSGDDFARVLTPTEPYQVVRLFRHTRTAPGPEAFEAWRDYFPRLIIDGARTHLDVIAPELANIAADEPSGHMVAKDYPPKFINRYAIDRVRMAALFGERLNEALEVLAGYSGTDPYAARAKEAAREWLDERRQGAIQTNGRMD